MTKVKFPLYVYRRMYLAVFFWMSVLGLQAGQIRGEIVDEQGSKLPGIAVKVKGMTIGTISDNKGIFILDTPVTDNPVLIFSGIGFQRKEVSVPSIDSVMVVKMQPADYELQSVLVMGRKERNYFNSTSFLGTRTASKVTDIPQSVSSVTKELMEDLQAFQITDVVGSMAGVNTYSAYDDLTIRGFRSGFDSGFRLVNGLRSGYGYGTSYFRIPLTVNLESIEVLKGPGAALFGDISPGGTVNMVTKKPLDEARQAVNFSTGSFNTIRTTMDLTGPFGSDTTLLYRLNVGYEDTRTFRDVNNRSVYMVAPTVTFRPTTHTTINAEMVLSNFKGYLDRGISIRGGDLYGLPRSFTLSQPSDYFNVRDVSFNASVLQKINRNLSMNFSYLRFQYHEDLSEHRTLNSYADSPLNTIMNVRYLEKKIHESTDNFSAYLNGNFQVGNVRNDLVAGVDFIRYETDKNGYQWEARHQIIDHETKPLTFDLNNPTYELKNVSNYVRMAISPFFVDYLNTSYQTTGLYLQNHIHFSSRLKLLLGIRHERFQDKRKYGNNLENISQTSWNPRLGLTYKVLPDLTYFASYSQGFKPVSPEFIRNPANYGKNDPFRSESSYQAETGLKAELFKGRLFSTFSMYQIERSNMLVNTGQVTDNGNPVYRQNGKVRSRGLEAEVNGQLLRDMNISVNYAFNQTSVLDTDLEAEKNMPLANAPRHSAGWWIKYHLPIPKLRGAGVGYGGQYVGERRMENMEINSAGKLEWMYWPSYMLNNVSVFYKKNKYGISLNVNNIFDTYYYMGGFEYARAFPGSGRNWMLSVGYSF